jgi:hypothetical protein
VTEEAYLDGEPWQQRLRAAAQKGVAYEEAREAELAQARRDFDDRKSMITKSLRETIAPSLREVIAVAAEVGLSMELIVEPPDPSVTLQIRGSTLKYALLDDATLLLTALLPSGRADRDSVPPDVSAESVKERAAQFVEAYVNELVVQRVIR